MPTVTLEILDQNLAIFANLAEIHRLAAFGKEEKSVESLEEHAGRLMYSAQDGLSSLRELFHQVCDSPARLTT